MISIVLPSYKGSAILEGQLPVFQKYLTEKKIDAEIIVIDDGSGDKGKTRIVAEKLGCQFIQLDQNKGKGAAVREGIKQSRGELCIFTDVDIPFEFDAFPAFIESIINRNFDIVVGDRTLPESSYFTEIGLTRKLGSDIFAKIVSKIFTDGLHDTQCGMKAFKKEVANDLFSVARINRFAFDVELISIAVKRNYQIERLPVKFRCNDSKSVRVLRHGIGMLLDLIKISVNHKTGRYHKK